MRRQGSRAVGAGPEDAQEPAHLVQTVRRHPLDVVEGIPRLADVADCRVEHGPSATGLQNNHAHAMRHDIVKLARDTRPLLRRDCEGMRLSTVTLVAHRLGAFAVPAHHDSGRQHNHLESDQCDDGPDRIVLSEQALQTPNPATTRAEMAIERQPGA